MTLYFVTGNEQKFEEVKLILKDMPLERISLDLPELQGEPEEIVKEKARIACKLSGKIVIVEDTGLCFNALNGLPGPYVKDFLKKLGIAGLYKLISHYDDRTGYAQVCVGYCEPNKEPLVFSGRIDCRFVEPAGSTRFQFDQILIPNGRDKRFSEMSIEEKSKFSHRKIAFENFKKWYLSHSE